MESHSEQHGAAAKRQPPRRKFFHWLAYGLGAIASAIIGLPFIGYVFGTQKRKVDWVDLGSVSKFPQGETRIATFDNPIQTPWDGIVARTNVFVRYEGKNDRQADTFLVFTVNCAHLGCPVSWFPQSGLFLCPCHGGAYYANGERASGPPPRGLFHCEWRVTRGKLEIQAPHFPTLQDTEDVPV